MFEIDMTRFRLVDLSFTVVPGGDPARPFNVRRGLLADRAFKYDVETHTHVGTHVELPVHFFGSGKDVTGFALTAFMGRAILLDIEDPVRDARVDSAAVDSVVGDIIRENDIVICRNRRPDAGRPYLTADGAGRLRAHKVKMIGIDGHFGLGSSTLEGRKIHDLLMGQDVTLVEFLDNLASLTRREFFFMALPFKAKGIDSCWARAVAVEDR